MHHYFFFKLCIRFLRLLLINQIISSTLIFKYSQYHCDKWTGSSKVKSHPYLCGDQEEEELLNTSEFFFSFICYVLILKIHWSVKVLVAPSCLALLTPWTVASWTPLSMGFSRQEHWEWVAIPFSRGSSWVRDQTGVSCIADRFFTIWTAREASQIH